MQTPPPPPSLHPFRAGTKPACNDMQCMRFQTLESTDKPDSEPPTFCLFRLSSFRAQANCRPCMSLPGLLNKLAWHKKAQETPPPPPLFTPINPKSTAQFFPLLCIHVRKPRNHQLVFFRLEARRGSEGPYRAKALLQAVCGVGVSHEVLAPKPPGFFGGGSAVLSLRRFRGF